jgi:glutamine synthetase
MSNNLDQLTDWLKDHKITEVECMIGDLTGITRGKISPTNKFIAEKGMRLPESVLLQTVTATMSKTTSITNCSTRPTST